MENEHWIVHVEKLLEPVLPLFTQMRWQDLDTLRKCIELSDFDSIKKLSHKLLGAPGVFGFDYLIELAHEMENSIEKKDKKKLTSIAAKYENFMNHHEVKID